MLISQNFILRVYNAEITTFLTSPVPMPMKTLKHNTQSNNIIKYLVILFISMLVE